MQYPTLLTADLHLVSSSSAEYRWQLFPWLAKTIKEERVKTLQILGDLTDAKDNHSAELVNRIVHEIASLPVEEINILSGNHDWLRQGHEFFRFLNRLGNVRFITAPEEDQDVASGRPLVMYLPYSKQPAKDWQGFDLSHYDYVFMHQTIRGAKASNGELMEGEDLPDLSAAGKIYSGDIHVPQICGPLEYVGSPYHVHLGDKFKPRCVLLERGGEAVDLHFDSTQRFTMKVSSLKELEGRMSKETRERDQLKIRIELEEADKHGWAKIRREALAMARDFKLEVHGVELLVKKGGGRVRLAQSRQQSHNPGDALARFVEAEELGGDALELGLEIIES